MSTHPDPALQALTRQFTAAIDMLCGALAACPDRLWQARLWTVTGSDEQGDLAAFWYLGYHSAFWLDLYLEGTLDGFAPPAPFNLDELDPAGLLPPRVYSRAELLGYLAHGRAKCVSRMSALRSTSDGPANGFPWMPCSYIELQMVNMRNVQEHGAQLNLFLGQAAGLPAHWVKFGDTMAT